MHIHAVTILFNNREELKINAEVEPDRDGGESNAQSVARIESVIPKKLRLITP